MDFYSNYIALCNKIGISPSAAAERAGTTKTSVNRWKRGSIPSDATLQKLSDFFSCSIEELTEKGQKEAPAAQGDGLDVYRDIISGLCGNDQEKLRLLQDALSKNPEKTKASFDLFLKTL